MRMEGTEGFQQSVSALVRPTILEDPNLNYPTLFPYSLAAIFSCMARHPLLSFQILDSCCPLRRFEANTACRSLTLPEVVTTTPYRHFITHRDRLHPTFYPDLHEKCQIEAFLHILKPHLHRCRSLHVNAHLGSSFPIIHKAFHEIEALNLEFMELICDTHAFADDENDSDWDDGLDEFEPDLTHLVIDGKNFRLTCENLDNWLNRCVDLQQMTFAHSEPGENDGYGLENLFESIDGLPSLNQLKLEGLHFSYALMIPPKCSS